MIRIVVDTNVVFQGLTQPKSDAGRVLSLWSRSSEVEAWVCNALEIEYKHALSRELSPPRWRQLEPMLNGLLNLAREADIYISWRPMSPDPGDDHVIDCAMNASAVIVTFNKRDFRRAQEQLGLQVMTPAELLDFLERQAEGA